MQLLSVIPISILLLYLLVSIDLAYTGVYELVLRAYPKGAPLWSKISSNLSDAETTSSFSTYK